MALADGSAVEYDAIMFGSVNGFIRKFEHQIKLSNGKGSN